MERGGAFGMDWRSRPWDDLGFGGNSNGKRADVKLIDLDNLQSGTPYMADDLPCGWQRLLQKAIDYRLPPHILWAVLIARIYEVLPLLCPLCGGQMRIIAFIAHSADIRHIVEHIGVDLEPPRIKPARGPPLWDACDARGGEGMEPVPDWDEAAQLVPEFEVDQRISW